MSASWKKWLALWCWIVVAFGAVLTGAASEVTDGPVRLLVTVMNPAASVPLDPLHRFAIALMGAVTLGWGLTLKVAIDAAHRLGDDEQATWRGVVGAMLLWFVVDSSLSIATGFALNAASNAVLLIGFLLPILAAGLLGSPERRPR